MARSRVFSTLQVDVYDSSSKLDAFQDWPKNLQQSVSLTTMRFISILASASVKLATRVPGATKVVCPTSPEMAPINLDAMGDDYFQTINDDYREAVVPDIYKAGYATLHPVDTGAAIPIYPSLAEGTSDRWARGEVRAHLDALRP